ncbi:MAG: hypothetical protein HW377_1205, partial [Actinobacteria bacterium]|nr:hypothetical protein [Actinomycetota bacterium]
VNRTSTMAAAMKATSAIAFINGPLLFRMSCMIQMKETGFRTDLHQAVLAWIPINPLPVIGVMVTFL